MFCCVCLSLFTFVCLCSWASGDKRFTTYTISCIREQWEACLWVCMLVHLLVCVQYCFAYCVCLWINRAWMMLMLMMVSEHEIWQSVHWFLPFGCIFTVISCSLILFGSFSVPGTLLCAKTPSCGLGVCSVGFRLLNAYVFNVSASQMFYPVWERFSDCQMWHIFFCPPFFTFSVILTLLRSTCIVLPVKLFPLMDQVLLYYSTTVHAKLCTEKTVCTQLESGVLV